MATKAATSHTAQQSTSTWFLLLGDLDSIDYVDAVRVTFVIFLLYMRILSQNCTGNVYPFWVVYSIAT